MIVCSTMGMAHLKVKNYLLHLQHYFLIFTFTQIKRFVSYLQMRKIRISDFYESKHITAAHIATELCFVNIHVWTRFTGNQVGNTVTDVAQWWHK
jgi:hypothetical protein